ncbi:MAG: hypothetical protein FWB89_01785 [Treponema sp.]|nr:hypothetical protein [Treponema sp.]
MNGKRLFLFFIFLFCVTAFLSAFGRKEKETIPEKIIIQVTGIIRLVGSEPFPELVISSSEGKQWYIASDEADKLRDLQYQTVTAEGEETVMQLTSASGRLTLTRRELRNVKIISAEH